MKTGKAKYQFELKRANETARDKSCNENTRKYAKLIAKRSTRCLELISEGKTETEIYNFFQTGEEG